MRGIEIYDRLIDVPGPSAIAQLFYAGVFLVAVAVLLVSLRRMRWLGRGLGIVGVLCFMLAMFLIHEQKIVETTDKHVVVTRWRYSPATRFQVRVALVGLPTAAAFLMMQFYWSTQRRQRARIPARVKAGRLRLVQGDLPGALEEFDAIIDVSPYLGEGYFHRATVYLAQHRPDDALADLDQALRCDPQLTAAYLARGRLLSDRDSLEAAEADLDRYLAARSSDVEGYLARGLCRVKAGRDADAVADLQRVLKLTNHSDYTDPARAELDRLYAKMPGAEETEALQPPDVPIKSVLDSLPKYDVKYGEEAESRDDPHDRIASDLPSDNPAAQATTPQKTLPPR